MEAPFVPGYAQLALRAIGGDDRAGVSFWGINGLQRLGIIYFGQNHTVMSSDATAALSWHSGGVERFRIDDSGNVGIGTATPGAKLEVGGGVSIGSAPVLSLRPNALFLDYLPSSSSNRIFGTGPNDSTDGKMVLGTASLNGAIYNPTMTLTGGNVGVGITAPTHRLSVAGAVRATSFISDTATYADFVFKPGYRLAPLPEVEAHIVEKGHLPDIPSEAEARPQGIDLTAMQIRLLQKIEELTLHAIEQNKQIEALQHEVQLLKESAKSSL